MKNLIVLSLFFAAVLAQSWYTVNKNGMCTCSQLKYIQDCTFYGTLCYWNATSSTCNSNACGSITSQTACAASNGCQWNLNTASCGNFQSCSSLMANTNLGCYQLSNQCRGSNGTNCQSEPPQACSNFTSQSNCTYGNNGECLWVNNTCSQFSSCGQANNIQLCNSFGITCAWNSTACVSAQCSNFTTNSCYFIRQSPTSNQFSTCVVQNGTCTNGSPSQLNATNCWTNTLGYFAWSTNNASSGSCQECYSSIFSAIIIALMLLFA